MSMTIGTTPGVNELQLQAMLTGQLKEATRLEGWEAFKNFFIKLLNHLPGMNLEDKEKNLRDIYNMIYGEKTAAASDKTHSIETLWPAVERLIHLMEGDHVRAMEFELISHNVSGTTGQLHVPARQNLVIRVDDHTLPEIALSNSDKHHYMLSSVLTHHMINKNGALGVYQLDPAKLISLGRSVELASPAVMATSHGFNVAKALEASRVLVQTPVKEIRVLDDQIAQLEHYQQLIADLTQLRAAQDVRSELHREFIDNELTALHTHRQQQLESFQHLNHEFVDNLVKECVNNLEQEGVLSKEAINAKISLLSTLTPHMDALFHDTDRHSLQCLQSQLELLYRVADLQELFQYSEIFPQEQFSSLQAPMRQAETGPLTTLLNGTFNAIWQISPDNLAKKAIEAQAQQASEKFVQSLEEFEENMAKLLDNPDNRLDFDSKMTKKMVTQAAHLSPFTPEKMTLISRAETVHQQNVAITRIDKFLSEGLTLADRNVLDFPRERVISELQTLNTQLPESQRKSSYQLQIDGLNEGLLRRMVDIWQERIGSMPEAGRSAASENAVQALLKLKDEVQQLNIAEQSKREFKGFIVGLIVQHQSMESVEATLHHYKGNNKYAIKEVVSDLSEKLKAIIDCPRKSVLMEHINALQIKNEELDLVNKELDDVDRKITAVTRFQATWSEDLAMAFTKLKTQVQALPDGSPKKLLLDKISTTEKKLPEIQNLERMFSQTGTLLAKATEPNGSPSLHWMQALAQLKQAATESKKLPGGLRANGLATRLGNDTDKALNLLKGMIDANPRGDKKYMAEREKDYKYLRDIINSMTRYLPNAAELTEVLKKIKHENNFRSRSLLEKI
ncbi:hypothetical protein ABFY47_24845 [Enterobacter ludwigii]|uniref:hypothetical protein n=1 Tax=Enterobacter ludwigii TaxID=299767 RepID=UPI003D19D4E6